jgi:hypothetical protein
MLRVVEVCSRSCQKTSPDCVESHDFARSVDSQALKDRQHPTLVNNRSDIAVLVPPKALGDEGRAGRSRHGDKSDDLARMLIPQASVGSPSTLKGVNSPFGSSRKPRSPSVYVAKLPAISPESLIPWTSVLPNPPGPLIAAKSPFVSRLKPWRPLPSLKVPTISPKALIPKA